MNAQTPTQEILPAGDPWATDVAKAPAEVSGARDGGALLSMIARAASDPKVDIEKFERLLALHRDLQREQELRDFNAALAAAKGEISPVVKNRVVDFTTAKGRTNYRYEDFAAVTRAVDGALSRQGLSYRFRAEQSGGTEGQRKVKVTCILSRGGYSEETSLECFEDHSGNKNPVQAIQSAATYLQRATLKLMVGLAAGEDDDGQASSKRESDESERLGSDEVAYVRTLLRETNSDEAQFLRAAKAESVEAFTPKQFKWAVDRLNQKKAMGAGQ